MKKIIKKGILSAFAIGFTMSIFTNVAYASSQPPHMFGGAERPQAVHFNDRGMTATAGLTGGGVSNSNYSEGDRIGTLHIPRLNRTISVFEGETMRNMDFGAGRFTFSGLESGNVSLIGHNRGRTNGFFSFVRQLETGDRITFETNNSTRTFEVSHEIIINATDFSPLMEFGDNRLTLVTCVEYRRDYRRVAVAFEI